MKKKPVPSVFDQIVEGLQAGIAYTKGQLSLQTTVLPAPPPQAAPKTITRLRMQLNMSQAVFAATLNVSTKTVQGWEQGIRRPNQASLRLLQVLQNEPKALDAIFAPATQHARSGAKPARNTLFAGGR